MQEQILNQIRDAAVAPLPKREPTSILRITEVCLRFKLRIALPLLPRPQLCLGDRAARAKMRAAELAAWEASGGDFLRRP